MMNNKWPSSLFSFICMSVLLLPYAVGLQSWHQSPSDFNRGVMINTQQIDDNLSLANNKSYKNNWIQMNNSLSPNPRLYQALTYDSESHLGILFGGEDIKGTYNDTWIYDITQENWIKKSPVNSPSPRWGSAITYDTQNDIIILFGGAELISTGIYWYNDTWTYDYQKDIWTNMTPSAAPPLGEYYMVYNPNGKECIMFGGNTDFPPSAPGTWSYSLKDNTWIKHPTAVSPSIRSDTAMVYDDPNHLILLFGGFNSSGLLNDTWTLNPETYNWTQRWPLLSPSKRTSHAMAFDIKRGETILFGGWCGGYDSNETWFFNATDNIWRKQNTLISPPPRQGHSIYYDSYSEMGLLFGGIYQGSPDSPILNDTWCYDLDPFYQNGTYISQAKDTGDIAVYGTIEWSASNTANTSIDFQLRSADTQEELLNKSFIGPDGTNSTFYNQSGQHIASIHNGSRWIQLKAYLSTQNILETPQLHDIEIQYNRLQHLSISSPLGAENWTGIQNITWAAYDNDNDSLLFDIYLENSSTSILLANSLPNETREWSWNTSMIPNGTYSIRIVARDDNPSIPLKVNATSGNFTIYHPPPPNHLPHVDLLSPPDNSIVNNTSVRLSWRGSDLDGDQLTYTVRYSDNPLMQGSISSNSTTDALMDLLNLTENKTYYWTVDAFDGKSNGTDIPTAIWSFAIKVNHPPKITSTPQLSVQVGDIYEYNITAGDVDNDATVLSIIQAPTNVSFNSSKGNIHWTPNNSDVGNHTIIIQVSDGKGGIDRQTFTITVVPKPPPEAPKIMITYPTNGSKIGGIVTIRGTAVNGSNTLLLIQVRIDGGNWRNAIGLKNWSISVDMSKMDNGKHKIEARAYDGNLYSDTASVSYSVYNPEPLISVEGGLGWIIIIVILAAIGISFVIIRQMQGKGPPKGQ